jgi:hypothetical protein
MLTIADLLRLYTRKIEEGVDESSTVCTMLGEFGNQSWGCGQPEEFSKALVDLKPIKIVLSSVRLLKSADFTCIFFP